jgi:polyhydroxybutyrate depolymerase
MNWDASTGVYACDKGEVFSMTVRRAWLTGLAAAALLSLLAACTSTAPLAASSTPTDTTPTRGTMTVKDGDRPFTLHVPMSYDPSKPVPLVILLHGYTATGAAQESYFKITPESDKHGFLYAYPDGLVDPMHNHYWNATDACCDLYGSKVDDSTYLSNLIKLIEKSYNVDTKRVYLIGHSNGAFMEFRMACDHADQITAIAALNGAMWQDVSKCQPSTAVSILDVRSTADQLIFYAGGKIANNAYPSAATTNQDWLTFDKCANKPTTQPSLDLVQDLPGAETSVAQYTSGCAGGSTMETWTINGGMHIPNFNANWAPDVVNWLLTQTKPASAN